MNTVVDNIKKKKSCDRVSVGAVQLLYLLIKAVLLLNDKCVVQTPGKSRYGTEEGGKRQKYQGLGDLILWTESKANSDRTSDVPQKGDSTQQQDQLRRF